MVSCLEEVFLPASAADCGPVVILLFDSQSKSSHIANVVNMASQSCLILRVLCNLYFASCILLFCYFACVCYTRNVIINVTSIGRQISEIMFLW